MNNTREKLVIEQAIVVEGRDDVAAVSRACDTLLIPTHGFGITKETWGTIQKAYDERGIIILTDPDFSGEEIRRKLTARFPESIQAYIAQTDAIAGDDIGVENARPEIIAEAIEKALALSNSKCEAASLGESLQLDMRDLTSLGLSGSENSNELRSLLCAKLGIGYGNAKSLLKKLNYWKIGYKELEQAIEEITEKK